MKIRKATKKDIPGMLKLIKLNNPKYNKNRAIKELNEMFSMALHKPTYHIMEKEKEIISFGGFISSWVDNNVYNIFWINTSTNFQNKGIGTKLIKSLIKEIRKEKNPKAKLITVSTKIPSFYKKLGFKTISQKYDRNYLLMGLR